MAKKRWCAWVLALVLAWSVVLPAAAAETAEPLLEPVRSYTGQFSDLEGAWCEEEAVTVYEAGLMDGRAAARFDVESNLTYAQIVVIAARLHDLLSGGDGELDRAGFDQPWYGPAREYLTEALTGADSTSALYLLDDLQYLDNFADQSCDRYDFVWYLAAVLPEEILTPINDIPSLPDADDADILRFYRAGILTGTDGKGTFNGFELLDRGQAAAILARIADPSRRISFTLETPNYAREVLGLDPDTVLLTVDGYAVTAETYLSFLAANIEKMEADQADSCYDQYPQYYDDYLQSGSFTGSFPEYLLEIHGIDASAALDWNAPDIGGMSPAQKVLSDTLADVKEQAVLLARQEDYPLAAAQEAALSAAMASQGVPYGYTEAFLRQALTAAVLMENLAQRYPLSAQELTQLLADQGYLYGQYAVIYRNTGAYDSDDAAAAAAREVRQKLTEHLDDPEYLEFLIWKYSQDSNTTPDLLPISVLSDSTVRTLKELAVGRVSPVLEDAEYYMVVVKLDPTENRDLLNGANAAAAQARLLQWAEDAQTVTTAAYDSLDVAAAAGALKALGI